MNLSALTIPPRLNSITALALAVSVVVLFTFVPSSKHGQSPVFTEQELDAILLKHGPGFLKKWVWRAAVLLPDSWHRKVFEAEETAYGRRRKGQYAEAAILQESALKSRKSVYGIDAAYIFCKTELAWIYEDYGQFNRAEQEFKEALAESETALGMRHENTDRLRGCLAYLFERQGRFSEAEFFNLKRLELPGERDYDHFVLRNLARVYTRAGRYAEAERIYKKIMVKPGFHAFPCETELAALYQQQKRYIEAKALLNQQLQKYAPGTLFFPVLSARLASLHKEVGDLDSAETLYNKLIERESARTCGYDWIRIELADVYKQQGRYRDAEQLYSKLIQVKEKRFGRGDLKTTMSIDDLGHLFESEGRYTEAETQYNQALQIRLKSLCKEHPDVGESFRNLSNICKIKGRNQESTNFYKDSLISYKQCLTMSERRMDTELP